MMEMKKDVSEVKVDVINLNDLDEQWSQWILNSI